MDPAEAAQIIESAQKVARQVDAMARQAQRAMEGPIGQLNQWVDGSMARWQKSINIAARQNQASIEQFRQTTAALDRHQYARVNRLVESWMAPPEPPRRWALYSQVSAFVEWVNRRRRPDRFALELRRAHEHPSVSRKGRATGRLWFEEWRRTLLFALADGHSLERIRAETSGVSPPRRLRIAVRPPRRGAARRLFQERLRHSIFTHGPTTGASPNGPINGDELLVSIG